MDNQRGRDNNRGQPDESAVPVISHMADLPSNSRIQLNPSVAITPGLPNLPARLVDSIKAGEYIDSGKLPPAKGLSKSIPLSLEGQVLVIQASDLTTS